MSAAPPTATLSIQRRERGTDVLLARAHAHNAVLLPLVHPHRPIVSQFMRAFPPLITTILFETAQEFIVILTTLFVLKLRFCKSVVPMKSVAGLVAVFPVRDQPADPPPPPLGVCQLARPLASDVRTFPAH